MRKTKIICTLGPATDCEERIRELILAGMDVARFNFSHGSYEEHLKKLEILRSLREELHLPIASLLDTKGPEIRLGKFQGGKAELTAGEVFTLTTREIEGDSARASISFAGLPGDVDAGSRILLDDGLIELRVLSVENGTEIICQVVNGGPISNNKGVNVPGVRLSLPYISDKDRSDILWGIDQGFDFIAASFTRSADDILEVRKILDSKNCHTIRIIAKIENAEGVANIDDILHVSDGVMIARGDMGVEIPLEDVPVVQKMLIKKAYSAGKQVITATQMLDSMMKHPRPTRAEATDVANAIYDGTSAIMLSGETAAGLYPIEAVRTMARIAERAEDDIDYRGRFIKRDSANVREDVTNAISHATCTTAYDLGAAAIITVTKSGNTAKMISKYRPSVPIIGGTPDPVVYRQMNLSWGVTPLLIEEQETTDKLFQHAVDMAQGANLVKSGDIVVITAGVPLGIPGTTNLLKVHLVGDVLVSGAGANKLSAFGNICVAKNEEEALTKFQDSDILVMPHTSNNILPLLKKASGIITEAPGLNSHAAIVGMTLDIPVIVGAEHATAILKSGTAVTVDAGRGIVCAGGAQRP
ncbi:pyruvate kinase [Clostridiaceae bacterium NSJ-31]|uniref:Pyruvate kinase n=1 Tax=Ligaoa zhengdingensis TaxID=2763658 RepID=A0A926DZF7_9FIRM|nr:pyruvate kinase [Ligaoa zhengdingensis]MBC8546627.1 pyruvate kinase [Ligaoa zhengdingensis]